MVVCFLPIIRSKNISRALGVWATSWLIDKNPLLLCTTYYLVHTNTAAVLLQSAMSMSGSAGLNRFTTGKYSPNFVSYFTTANQLFQQDNRIITPPRCVGAGSTKTRHKTCVNQFLVLRDEDPSTATSALNGRRLSASPPPSSTPDRPPLFLFSMCPIYPALGIYAATKAAS